MNIEKYLVIGMSVNKESTAERVVNLVESKMIMSDSFTLNVNKRVVVVVDDMHLANNNSCLKGALKGLVN